MWPGGEFSRVSEQCLPVRAVRGEIAGIDRDVEALLASMQESIAEAEDFVKRMRSDG